MYSDSELHKILDEILSKEVETEMFELKTAKDNFDFSELGKYFSALSNEANLNDEKSAWLIFGITNNREVVGSSYRMGESKLQSLKKEIADKTNERITFREIYSVSYAGKRIVMFEIPAAVRGNPTSFGGFCYGREGESLNPLSEEERERILSQSRISDWSKNIVLEASIKDLDPAAISAARENFVIKNPHLEIDVKSWDNITFLNKARVTLNGKITNTALILLGTSEGKALLSPADVQIRWILKDENGIERDYYIGTGPFILEVEKVLKKIRNLRYRYLQRGTLFPDEVDQYDPYTIREALHNAIAHQDYTLGERITVVEMPDFLIFSNAGLFLPGTVEEVIQRDVPSERYRNQFLAVAMHNLNMVDTIGSGIKKMFLSQREKFFPMPDFDIASNHVKVTVFGKVLDDTYAGILSENSNLSLSEVMLLDKIQKRQEISKDAAAYLRKKGLIEGRRPNYYLSREVAIKAGERSQYTVDRGLDKKYYLDFIFEGISRHGSLTRTEINELLWNKLPECYNTDEKKRKKVEHLLSELRQEGRIYSANKGRGGSLWYPVTNEEK